MTQTILLVDDEPIEREVIEHMLNQALSEESLHFLHANNGQEAIALCQSITIDLIFMDINMPKVDGLQAVKEINALAIETDVIMVSAYDTFSYAKQAIDYGVQAYLLKPAAKDDVLAVYHKVMTKRRDERLKREKLTDMTYRTQLSEGLIGGENTFSQVAIALVNAEVQEDLLRERLTDARFIVGPVFGAHIPIGIIDVPTTEEVLSLLKSACLTKPIIRFSLGRVTSGDDLRQSYEEALISYYDLIDREDSSYSVYHPNLTPALKDLDRYQLEVVHAFEKGETAHLKHVLTPYFHQLKQTSKQQLNKMRRYVEILLGQLVNQGLLESRLSIQQQLALVDSKAVFQTLLSDFLVKESERLTKQQALSSPVDQAVRYVDDHFTDPTLTLEQLAEVVGLSLFHLSKAFKQKTQQPFVEYVRDKRLTYAKQLLRQNNLPLKAVAYEAGFTDPNYFSRTFKKIEGVPPSKYLTSH